MMYVLTAIALVLVAMAGINIAICRRNRQTDPAPALAELRFKLDALQDAMRQLESGMRGEIAGNREELGRNFADNRNEVKSSFQLLADQTTKMLESFSRQLGALTQANEEKFHLLTTTTDTRLTAIRDTMDLKLKSMQEDNGKRLEEMRRTVDEKLQESVEKRFNESFKNISERLDLVHKGLGEMQSLATGVGDLKKVLTNVKTRGNLGEIQLAAILEQCLAPDQYVVNAAVRPNSAERVEFAVKMPGRDADLPAVLLPIDSKFPVEDYQRLLEAYEQAAPDELKIAQRAFESAVKKCAADIHGKYINPPATTDFALMFVPTEGLYAEILRLPGLFEQLQREWKIAVVGPSNLLAFLNSLQMGFRTLAIEKRSGEVWSILGAVKTEFGRFGDILDKTRNKLESAVTEIDNAGVRSRAIVRKLRTVQELPAADAAKLLEDAAADAAPEEESV